LKFGSRISVAYEKSGDDDNNKTDKYGEKILVFIFQKCFELFSLWPE